MLQKDLSPRQVLIKTKYFPYNSDFQGGRRVTLGIGGNIGDVIRRFTHLFWYFQRSSLLRIVQTSPILKNPPFGYTKQDDFYNAILSIETRLQPKALLRYILEVERKFGRRRSFQDAPRTLDIDIIFYENRRMQTAKLTLPHASWQERDSVVIPLSTLR